jgi:N-ethylmaleimide reductase
VVNEIGKERTAVRFSPFGTVLMPLDKNPAALFTYVLKEVEKRGLAYVSLTQPRADLFLSESAKLALIQSKMEDGSVSLRKEDVSLKPFTSILRTTPVIATGGYNAENCFEEVEKGELDAVSFGKFFISNPDLVERLRNGWPLSPYDPSTFYAVGKKGYTDHPSIAEAESRGMVWS